MHMKKNLLAILLMLSAKLLFAQQPAPSQTPAPVPAPTPQAKAKDSGLLAGLEVSAERSRIAAERQAVEARFKQDEAACYKKFAVNDCVDALRAVRREKLADLRRQEISLNDAERKRKGAEQLRRMEDKEKNEVPPKAMQKQERAKPQSRSSNPAQGDSADPQPRQPLSPAHPRTPHTPAVKDPAVTEVEAAQERERYQRKLDEAAEHKAQTLKRNAERTKPAAKSLPPAP